MQKLVEALMKSELMFIRKCYCVVLVFSFASCSFSVAEKKDIDISLPPISSNSQCFSEKTKCEEARLSVEREGVLPALAEGEVLNTEMLDLQADSAGKDSAGKDSAKYHWWPLDKSCEELISTFSESGEKKAEGSKQNADEAPSSLYCFHSKGRLRKLNPAND